MLRIIAVLFGTTVASALCANPVGAPETNSRCGDYLIQTFRDQGTGNGSFEILRDSQRIFEKAGHKFFIGKRPNYPDTPPILVGQDLTACGAPHVVIYEWSGGAHCCKTAYVFRLGKDFRQIAEIHGEDSDPEFREDGLAKPWLVYVRDSAFSYWPRSFAASPAPQVILRWDGEHYVVARDRMKLPAPPRIQLEARAAKLRSDALWYQTPTEIPPDLYITALDMMYAGHEELGWNFIKLAWNRTVLADDEFITGLKSRLAKSPYWPSLK